MIEIWERVRFKGSQPISWERSFDNCWTWEDVPWPGKELPFVRLDTSVARDFTTVTKTTRAEVPCIHSQDYSYCAICIDSDATGFV